MKRILMSTLAVLAIFSLASISFGSTGAYAIRWTQCTGQQIKANYEVSANIGSPSVAISWQTPAYSNEFGLYCTRALFHAIEISIYAQLSFPYNPQPSTFSMSSNSNTIVLTLYSQHCTYSKLGEVCFPAQPYALQYGNTVSISFTVLFTNSFGTYSHAETDTLKVTS